MFVLVVEHRTHKQRIKDKHSSFIEKVECQYDLWNNFFRNFSLKAYQRAFTFKARHHRRNCQILEAGLLRYNGWHHCPISPKRTHSCYQANHESQIPYYSYPLKSKEENKIQNNSRTCGKQDDM